MRKILIFTVLLLSSLLSGCVVQPVNSSNQPITSDGVQTEMQKAGDTASYGGYTIRAGDPLYIRFNGIMEQQQLEVVVDENGEIGLLHIEEPIKAAGLTTSALENKIERLYVDGGIYKNVSVNVTMTAKMYYVQGEVNQPGQFQLISGTTLIQAIAGARGYTPYANKKKVTVTRMGKVYTFNMKELEKDPSKDIKIKAGDVVKVWQSVI
ncbi:polysaccharide biosynthesis/export family protein [Pontiellaceae bacterium B1224]|nr:polysaccharide biosynthesis/export family protein [Pontiellaceae bacterium B1224]